MARRALQLIALLAFASFASFLVLGSAHAQLPPGEEPTETPLPNTNTKIQLEIDTPAQPLDSGMEFPVRVMVDEVEHLAGFDFKLTFDPDKVEFVRVEDTGQLVANSARGQNLQCPDVQAAEGSVVVSCVTFGPPVCLGGDAGASGSGLLGTMYFSARGQGDATIELSDSTMAGDDIEPPCDPDGPVVAIPHVRGDPVIVPITGGSGGGSSTILIIGIIVGVAAVVVVVGGGGFLWYRRRSAAAP